MTTRLVFSFGTLTNNTQHKHELLKTAKLTLRAIMTDLTTVDLPVATRSDNSPAYSATITAALAPRRLARLDLIFRIDRQFDGKSFTVLEIKQRLLPQAVDQAAVDAANYVFTPGGWDDGLKRMHASNFATHPLLDLSQLVAGRVVLRLAMVDLTEPWSHLNRRNNNFQRYKARTAGSGDTFKVFGYLGGPPLIWYGIVPPQAASAASISPHVFFSPSDRAVDQGATNSDYLNATATLFDDSEQTDVNRNLFYYLAPPIADVNLRSVAASVEKPEFRRNVVAVSRDTPDGEIMPVYWSISAGMQKAFRGGAKGGPRQIFLVPQRTRGASTGWATTRHLKAATDGIIDLLQSSSMMLGVSSDAVVSKDKMVLSCFSESGVDLWAACESNLTSIKAIVAIEPQNVNDPTNDYRKSKQEPAPVLGKEIIPKLLERQVQVFIIGRHNGSKYRPDITDIGKVRLLPKDPAKIFKYPPDPTANDFVKYRVQRIADRTIDPLMTKEERRILDDLAASGKVGAAAIRAVFHDWVNVDAGEGWYSHMFALTGGEQLKLDPSGLYDKPVTYQTFFEAAVQEIG